MAKRDLALQEIASAWAGIGNLERSVETSAGLSSPEQRDLYLLELLEKRAVSGETFGLASLAEAIDSEVGRARAQAYLGVFSPNRATAERHFQEAIDISEGIRDGLTQISTQAEIARCMMRSAPGRQQGTRLFMQAEQKVSALGSQSRKDLALAKLAGHRARALDPARSEHYLGLIKDPQVLAVARGDLQGVIQAIRSLPGTDKLASS